MGNWSPPPKWLLLLYPIACSYLIFPGRIEATIFVPTLTSSSTWAPFIFETKFEMSGTRIWCSALCEANPSCFCFTVLQDACHLGAPNNSLPPYLSDPGVESFLYLSEGNRFKNLPSGCAYEVGGKQGLFLVYPYSRAECQMLSRLGQLVFFCFYVQSAYTFSKLFQ